MSDLLPFIVVGVATGSLYGLAALGLVLTYRTSGVFNFAHGALAAASAYLFYTLHFEHSLPWPVAGVIAIGAVGVVGGVIMERCARLLQEAPIVAITVATIGMLLLVQGFFYWRYGSNTIIFPQFLPTRTVLTIAGVQIRFADATNIAVGVVSFVGLFLFLRRTRAGLSMRAIVGDADLLDLTGTDTHRTRTAAWIIGCSFAALTGVLIAPVLNLDAFLLSALVVQAFGAVAIGRFSSLPFTYAGGLVVGILSALATRYFAGRTGLTGIPSVVPFLVLIGVMLLTPAAKLPAGAGRTRGVGGRAKRLNRGRVVGTGAGIAVLAVIPLVAETRQAVYSTGLVFVLLFLALSLLMTISGQISLAHGAFAGLGAAVFSQMTVSAGLPWLVGLLLSGVVTGIVGSLLALPARRLSGIYLALATFGFGLLMQNVLFHASWLFGGAAQGVTAFRPELGPIKSSSRVASYYVTLAVVLLAAAAVAGIRRARLGRFLRAMADSPTALRTMGLGLDVTRILVFSMSAFLAGLAGALYAVESGSVSFLTISFSSTSSLLYVATLAIAAAFFDVVVAAFVAAGILVVLPSYLTWVTSEVQTMMFGGTAVLAALAWSRADWGALRRQWSARLDERIARSDERRARSPQLARVQSCATGPED